MSEMRTEDQRAETARRDGTYGEYLRKCPPEVDVRYLLDVSFFTAAHYRGCASVEDETGPCTCRLGMLREKYNHPVRVPTE
jgi:hypothetical protein